MNRKRNIIRLRKQTPSASDIKKAVQRILNNSEFKQKAKELQADYANYDSVSLAVESIEALIHKNKTKNKTHD